MDKTIFQFLFIVIFLLFILAIIHIFDCKEGYTDTVTRYAAAQGSSPNSIVSSPVSNYDPFNYNVQYHPTIEDIQSQLGIDTSANLVNIVDASGNIKQIPLSQTNSDSTYYTNGTLKYKPSNYVPNYEDTIYFSKLTGLGYQTPTINTNSQLSGFCKHDRYFPEKKEEKCGKLDSSTCASTTCCVLIGDKCVAGNNKGPYFKAHYGDLDLQNKDKYYYMGRCYCNCIDDQSNYYDYSVIQSFPSRDTESENQEYLPNDSNASGQSPAFFLTTNTKTPEMQCRIDRLGNLVNSKGSIFAYNVHLDSNGNFVDPNGKIVNCSNTVSSTPISAAPVTYSPSSVPVSTTPVTYSPSSVPVSTTPVTYSPSSVSVTPASVTYSPSSVPMSSAPVQASK